MASEHGTYRVFISSSMGEMREERAIITTIIEEEGYHPFLYEDDAKARPWNHEETFSQELKASHLYVGVFWKNYGPYTIQEFELAQACGIPRLVFEKRSPSGERDARLQKFLENINAVTNPDGVTIARFSSSSDLRKTFQESFKSFLAFSAKQGWTRRANLSDGQEVIPSQFLPCLCDRDLQEIQLGTQVADYFKIRSKRPLLLFLPGPVKERHGLYVDRIKLSSLEEYLTKAGLRGGKKVVQIRKSPYAMTSHAQLRSEVLGLLQERETGEDAVIVEHIKKKRLRALVIVVPVLASECEGDPKALLQLIAEYLAGFPDTTENVLVSMVICLAEDEESPKPWKWRKWLSRSAKLESKDQGPFDRAITEIKQQFIDGTRLRVESLPRLTSPRIGDVRRWLEHELVKKTRPHVAEKELDEIFAGQESLPMDDLYLKLNELLENRK